MALICLNDAGPHNENHYVELCSTEEMKANLLDLKTACRTHYCTSFTVIMAVGYTNLFLVLKSDVNTV